MASTRDSEPPRFTRRGVLAGMGGAIVLAACGGTSTPEAGGVGATTPTRSTPGLFLVPRFDTSAFAIAGSPQRLVVSIVDSKNDTPGDLPSDITFLATRDGTAVGAPIVTAVHRDGVPAAYFPVSFTPDRPGTYKLTAQLPNAQPDLTFSAMAADSSGLVAIGQTLPTTDTPTTTAPRGVTPVCTRQDKDGPDPCPLHDLNLRDALAAGSPVAMLVSTPKFCQIGVCGPVLDLVLEARDTYPGVQFIHVEVYKNPDTGSQDLAPAVERLGLNYEPALYLARADGTVVQRLDQVFDRAEIRSGLDQIAT